MTVRNAMLSMPLVLLFTYSGLTQAKEYDCNNLPSLQAQIKKDSDSASAAAMIIRFMGRNPNPCVKNIRETADAVEVKYLKREVIVSDVFNFSKENKLVSMHRAFSNGKTETINF